MEKERLIWITKDFVDKGLYAPFVVKTDIEYRGDLERKYEFLYDRDKCG